MLFCWTMVSFVGTALGKLAQTNCLALLAIATQLEWSSILKMKQPWRVFLSEVAVTCFNWPFRAFASESLLKLNWLINVMDNLYPRKCSREAFDCLKGHHEWLDFNAAFCVRAWIVATKNLRRWRTSSLPTSSFVWYWWEQEKRSEITLVESVCPAEQTAVGWWHMYYTTFIVASLNSRFNLPSSVAELKIMSVICWLDWTS